MSLQKIFVFKKAAITLFLSFLLIYLSPSWAAEPLQIFVSVVPQKYFAERVGGDQVKVEALIPPGFNHELYEPTAQQISSLAKADLYVRIGMPFEEAWLPRIQAVNKHMPILDSREGVKLLWMESHAHKQHTLPALGKPVKASEQDPHLWVSPRIVKQMVEQLEKTLAQLRPEQADYFKKNAATFTTELEQLDQELTELFKAKPQLSFMVFHPAWGYLADTYGLKQIPIEAEGKEPGAKALTDLIKQAQQEQVNVVFVQPLFSTKAAEQVAKAINGKVVSVDPMAEDYIPNLRKAARLIAGVDSE